MNDGILIQKLELGVTTWIIKIIYDKINMTSSDFMFCHEELFNICWFGFFLQCLNIKLEHVMPTWETALCCMWSMLPSNVVSSWKWTDNILCPCQKCNQTWSQFQYCRTSYINSPCKYSCLIAWNGIQGLGTTHVENNSGTCSFPCLIAFTVTKIYGFRDFVLKPILKLTLSSFELHT